MSRDRQIAVLASIVGLAGLIVGIVAISQVSGAEDDWVRNRALPGAASSEGAVLQTQFAVQEVEDLTERVAEIERLDTLAEQASTEADEKSDTTNVAVQGMTNEVADLTGRVAELEKTPLPAGPEEVMPTVEIPTEEVDYAENVEDAEDAGTPTTVPDTMPSTAIDAPIGLYGYNYYGSWDSEFQDYPWLVRPKSRPAYIDTHYLITINRADTQKAQLQVVDDYVSNLFVGESSTPKPGVKFIDDRYLRLEIQCNAGHLRVWLYPHSVNLIKTVKGHVILSPSYIAYDNSKVDPSANFRVRSLHLSESKIIFEDQSLHQYQIPKLLLDIPWASSDSGAQAVVTAYSDTYLMIMSAEWNNIYDNSSTKIHLLGYTDNEEKTCKVSYTGVFGYETDTFYSLK